MVGSVSKASYSTRKSTESLISALLPLFRFKIINAFGKVCITSGREVSQFIGDELCIEKLEIVTIFSKDNSSLSLPKFPVIYKPKKMKSII